MGDRNNVVQVEDWIAGGWQDGPKKGGETRRTNFRPRWLQLIWLQLNWMIARDWKLRTDFKRWMMK